MALKNRTESKTVVTNWAPVLDLEATHKPDLRDEILNNCLFRKDVATSDTAPSGTKTIDFLDIDYIAITQSTNVTYTLNNVQQGEIKYLKITKSAGQTIVFSGSTLVAVNASVLTPETTVLFRVINKDGSTILLEVISPNIATKLQDRGDPVTQDFLQTDLTLDSTWRDLDLSSIVPAGYTMVLLRVAIGVASPTDNLSFRKNGNSNDANVSGITAPINTFNYSDMWVEMDSSQVIEYNGGANLVNVVITIGGYM